MSLPAYEWAWKQTCKTPTEKLVLLALAEHHNSDTELCCPSRRRIAELVGISVSSVKRALRSLEDDGLLERIERRRGNGSKTSNTYQLPLVENGVENVVENRGGGVARDPSPGSPVTPPEPEDEPEQLTISSLRSEIGAGGPDRELEDEGRERQLRWLLSVQRRVGRQGKATGPEASADAKVLRWLVSRHVPVRDLVDAIHGVRSAADRGVLAGFIESGASFGAVVLREERNGRPLWGWAADRWRKEQGGPQKIGELLGAVHWGSRMAQSRKK